MTDCVLSYEGCGLIPICVLGSYTKLLRLLTKAPQAPKSLHLAPNVPVRGKLIPLAIYAQRKHVVLVSY